MLSFTKTSIYILFIIAAFNSSAQEIKNLDGQFENLQVIVDKPIAILTTVRGLNEDNIELPFSEESIKNSIERELKAHNINVVDSEAFSVVHLTVTSLFAEETLFYTVFFEIKLLESFSYIKDEKMARLFAPTILTFRYNGLAGNLVYNAVNEKIKELTDQFLIEYFKEKIKLNN